MFRINDHCLLVLGLPFTLLYLGCVVKPSNICQHLSSPSVNCLIMPPNLQCFFFYCCRYWLLTKAPLWRNAPSLWELPLWKLSHPRRALDTDWIKKERNAMCESLCLQDATPAPELQQSSITTRLWEATSQSKPPPVLIHFSHFLTGFSQWYYFTCTKFLNSGSGSRNLT